MYMNKSVYLLRTNPALTTNVKLVVSSDYMLYLESYNSNRELSDERFKRFKIDENVFLSERIAKFYKNLPIELAYDIKNDMDSDNIQDTFINQYDPIYWSGARYIENSSYNEEFQYNTTLKVCSKNLPKGFFIFRKDKTGADEEYNKDPNYFKELKLIKAFDLTNKNSIGKLFEKNFITDNKLPRSPLELNFKDFEFSKWKGYNYYSGGNADISFFLQEYLQNQNTYYNLEKFLTKGFQDNAIIASNYINISYLFDDTVCGVFVKGVDYPLDEYYFILKLIKNKYITEDQYTINISNPNYDGIVYNFNVDIPYRKSWTINRYTGFYIDNIILLDQISTYNGIKFKQNTDIQIINNTFVENGNNINPIDGKYKDDMPIYLKIKNKFYLVEKDDNGRHVVVSDELINGKLDDLLLDAQESIKIEYTQPTITDEFHSYIVNTNGTYYYNDIFDLYENGIFVIEIFEQQYTLYVDTINKRVYINTDEYIIANENVLYRKLGNQKEKYNNLIIENKDNNIIYFKISLLQFTDIKDFDFDRTDTTYTRTEYERNNEILYFRPGIYADNIKSTFTPKDLFYEQNYNIWIDDGTGTGTNKQLNTGNKYILSLASEYAVSSDLYMLNKLDKMTDIWNINQYVTKWGLNKSINNNSYAYKINNNLSYSGISNFTSFIFDEKPNINELNLDYFFTIGQPINYNEDIDKFISYNNNKYDNIIFRTLNIDMFPIDNTNNIHSLYKFDIDFYKNTNTKTDYFQYILNQNVEVVNGVQTHNRISYLQEVDEINGPEIYFKGFNAYVNYLQQKNPNEVGEYKKIPATDLVGYGFSIVFSSRYIRDENEEHRIGNGGIECIINKIHKNILINIYLCVPNNSLTNIEYTLRDELYSDSYVKYTVYDNNDGSHKWKNSTLQHEALTLKNFISTLDSPVLSSDEYKDGIHYNIIEDLEIFKISEVLPTVNNNEIKIKLANNIKLKHGDWIKIHNSGLSDYNNNIKVVEIINNRFIVCSISNDQTANIGILNNNIDNIYITKAISKKPFKFDIKYPDVIKVDTNKYETVDIDICPVSAINNSDIISDIVLDINNEGLIENLYNGQSINTKQIKKEYLELNDNDIRQLPGIYRYSGDYEPILKNINVFNKTKTITCENFDIHYISNSKIDEFFHVSLHVQGLINSDIGDMIYINNDLIHSNIVTELKFIEFTTHNIMDIKKSNMFPGYTEIVLSTKYDALSFPTIDILSLLSSYTMKAYVYKNIPTNTLFNFDYVDFGINKNIIITKVFTSTNPMRSIKNINNSDNKYALIDEHGSTVINKNIFKSPWDLTYYYETLPNRYKKI